MENEPEWCCLLNSLLWLKSVLTSYFVFEDSFFVFEDEKKMFTVFKVQ